MILIGLSFKAGLVPFHQWTPDVYQGAPTNVTAFMSTAAKIGAFAAMYRLLEASHGLMSLWLPVMSAIAIVTMIVGNVLALAQQDLKRLLAYSSISHAGYILVAVVAHAKMPTQIGSGTLCYYLLSYCLMTIGSFVIISAFANSGKEGTSYQDLAGLWRRSPIAAGLLVLFMLSLVGLPPLAGFFGKAFIFSDAVRAGLTPLAIVLALSSVISAAYYLRIAFAAFAADPEGESSEGYKLSGTLLTASGLCAIGIVAAVIFYSPLMSSLGFAQPAQRVTLIGAGR
jgi:NADH-quinone oxidoreductase subunit N